MTKDPLKELVSARAAYVQFTRRYRHCHDVYARTVRQQLRDRLDAAEQEFERGRALPEPLG